MCTIFVNKSTGNRENKNPWQLIYPGKVILQVYQLKVNNVFTQAGVTIHVAKEIQ